MKLRLFLLFLFVISNCQLVGAQEKNNGKSGSEESVSIIWGSQSRANSGDWDGAISEVREELQLVEDVMGTRSCATAATLQGNLSVYLSKVGRYTEAVTEGEEALKLADAVWGKKSKRYVYCLGHVSSFLAAVERFPEAIAMVEEALSLCEKTMGRDDVFYSNLEKAGRDYRFQWAQAELLTTMTQRDKAKECIKLIEKSVNLNGNGDLAEAINVGREALSQASILSNGRDSLYAIALSNLGVFLYRDGEYEESATMLERSLPIFELTHGRQSLHYAQRKSYLCCIYTRLGRLREALDCGNTALDYFEHKGRLQLYDRALAQMNMAEACFPMGYYDRAITLGKQALRIFELFGGDEQGQCLSLMAECCLTMGRDSLALEFAQQGSKLQRKLKGRSSEEYAQALVVEALACAYSEKYSEAIQVITQAIEILSQCVGERHDDYLAALFSLAYYHYFTDDYEKALEIAVKASNRYAEHYGENHPGYAPYACKLPMFYAAAGEKNSEIVSYSNRVLTSIIHGTFSTLTAAARAQFWQTVKKWYEQDIHNYAHQGIFDNLDGEGYDAVLISKGLLLGMETDFSKLIQTSSDSVIQKQYVWLQVLRQQAQHLREEGLTNRATSTDRAAAMVEQELVDKSLVFGDFTRNLVITWNQVQEKLTDKDIAVEFVSFPLNADSTMYMAYAIKKDWEHPKMIPLFEEKQLLTVQKGDRYTTDSISRLVWKPLDEVMQGVEKVYFAPSGELYNIAIELIPTHEDGGETLVGEHRNYYRLSSTRELALIKDESRWDEAAVYGGLQYGMSVKGMIEEDGKYEKTAGQKRGDSTPSYYVVREDSIGRGDRDLAQGLAYLEGTKEEAEAITHDLERKAVDARLFTDSIGTETSFKALGGKKTSVIHIGTHGFFNDRKKEYKDDKLQLLGTDQQAKVIEDDALTRSGLYFAGADNARINGSKAIPDSIDDGKLTALEIAQLDLRGLDLVVLSACQTGLGEITGDGVFGLQRGFKKAGAQTIVMSLWEVDDEATTEFMTTFFENIKIEDGHPTNKYQAFKTAQEKLRKNKDKYSDKNCWAAFVMLDGID